MRRLQKNFSRDLQNTLNLLGQSDIASPNTSYQQFTHHKNPTKKSPIQIVMAPQAQNSSKPKPRPKTKIKTKQNSPKPISKRKAPTKKHQKKLPDQISLNSILENPITSADPNIKKMFTLFHLERTYRQKKIEKMYNFYFYFWFKKLTRKLLKIRLDQQKSQSMIQSSSIIHITTPTADQLTQTELLSDESDIFNFSNDDVQDFPNAVNSLSDTQLIDKVITGTSIYNNDIDYDEEDYSFTNKNEYKQRRKEDNEQNLIENSFISWKSEQLSNDVIDKTCKLASAIIEESIGTKNSRKSNGNYNNNNNSVESKANNRFDQIDKYYDDDSKNGFINLNFADSSESNENSSYDEFNPIKRFNEYEFNENDNYNDEENENEDDFLTSDEIRSKISSFNHNLIPESSLSKKERNRPPPVDLSAQVLPIPTAPIIKAKPESELKKYLRNIITEEYFESIKHAQMRNENKLPQLVIPDNVQRPWQFTIEYCELITDVINEFTQSTDLKNYTTGEFIDYLLNFFEKSHYQRKKTIFAELETLYQKKFDNFLLTYSIDLADSLVQYQLDSVLGI